MNDLYPQSVEDSHEYIQQRHGWSVADMAKEIMQKDAMIGILQNGLIEKDQEIDKLKRQLANYEIRAHNALEFLRLVNCDNVDQANIACATAELNDIQRGREDDSKQ